MTKFSEVTDDLTSKPLQDKDIILFSNTTDGGTTFDVSKHGFVDEFIAFLLANGFVFDEDIVIVGTGTGIGESIAKISDLGDPSEMYLSHKDNHNNNDFALRQFDSGATMINAKDVTSVIIAVNKLQKILASVSGVQIAQTASDNFTVGLVVGTGIADGKTEFRGRGATDSTTAVYITNSAGAGGIIAQFRDDGLLLLRNGIIGGTTGEPDDFVLSHTNHHTFGEAAIQQAASDGWTYLSSAAGLSVYLGASRKIKITTVGVEFLVGLSDVVTVGVAAGSGTGSKLEVRGTGVTSGTTALDVTNNNGDIGLKVKDDSSISLNVGTSINEFSTDGTLAGDSDDAVPTEKAVKTFVDNAVSDIVVVEEDLTTSYTLTNADHKKIIELNNAAAIALTLNTGLRSDFACTYVQKGAGQVTISGTAILNNADGFVITEKQHVAISVIPSTTTDNYTIAGRLVP